MSKLKVKIQNITVGEKPLIIAGPCVIEDETITLKIAERLLEIKEKYSINFIFKASFDKANRSSIESFRGPGMKLGLEILSKVRQETALPITTDIHLPIQAAPAAEIVDLIQIPAFLSRQTDLLLAAAKTGKPVNIKKAQFMSPENMNSVIAKVESTGNKNIILTERGSCFGYNDLVVDPRSIPIMKKTGYPVILDVTHSLQHPSQYGNCSGGAPEFIPDLANVGAALNCDGLFFEVHPSPENALSDAHSMLELDKLPKIVQSIIKIWQAAGREIS